MKKSIILFALMSLSLNTYAQFGLLKGAITKSIEKSVMKNTIISNSKNSIFNQSVSYSKGLEKQAKSGDSDAQLKLGVINDECMKNYDEAFKWLKKSAEQGNITAQYNIGIMYNVGKGTQKNKAEAVKWLKKSAEQGNNYAQNYLKVYNNVETIKLIVIIVIAITIILLLKNIILSEKAEQ